MRLMLIPGALIIALAALPGCKPAQNQTTVADDGKPAIGGPFQLVDQNGFAVTDRDLNGRPSIVFFGYTYCPEVCPTTLAAMSRWLKTLGPDGDKLNVVYVTIDPERDTSKQLKQYLSAFDPRIRGLTGTPAQVAKVAGEYRVYYKRQPLPNGDYEMDHSTTIYMLDRSGQFVGPVGYGETDDTVVPLLRDLVAGRTPTGLVTRHPASPVERSTT